MKGWSVTLIKDSGLWRNLLQKKKRKERRITLAASE